jgi:transcriptional regulator with XRE-family HTH domain
MENKEKEYRKLKFGLALKKVMDEVAKKQELSGEDKDKGKAKLLSFRKLESTSGIRHATIVEIVNGKKNAAWSTVDALLEGLEIDLTQFALIYDSLSEQEVLQYKKELLLKKQEREKRKKSKKKSK